MCEHQLVLAPIECEPINPSISIIDRLDVQEVNRVSPMMSRCLHLLIIVVHVFNVVALCSGHDMVPTHWHQLVDANMCCTHCEWVYINPELLPTCACTCWSKSVLHTLGSMPSATFESGAIVDIYTISTPASSVSAR